MSLQSSPRRDAILEAALHCFDAHGYGATTMSEIRRQTGASTGSLYHHFPSRAHLAAELWVSALADYQRGFVDTLSTSPKAADGIRAVVHYHLQWVHNNPALARFLFTSHDADVRDITAPRLDEINKKFFELVLDWYATHVHRGELRELPPALISALWIGPAQEYSRAVTNRRTEEGRDSASAAAFLADGAWRALRKD